MKYSDVFKMPNATTIMARSSSITNSFVNGIIPCITPTEEEIKRALAALGMDKESIRCAYCGDKFTEWDHFRPLIENKKPTGYITEINNLVPSCSKCNQSKGNKNWRDWILSDAQLSPKTRRIANLDLLIKRLENFEQQSKPIKLNFEAIVGEKLWEEHWNNCSHLHNQMRECQELSDKIKVLIKESLDKQNAKSKEAFAAIDDDQSYRKIETEHFAKLINLLKSRSQKSSSVTSSQPKSEVNNEPQNSNTHMVSLEQKKVGIIAQHDLKNLLESNILPAHIIEKLQSEMYCKSVFDINFSVLLKINPYIDMSVQRKDHFKRDRYYASPIIINNEKYFLTSQWYERNKNKLIDFIETYRNIKN